MIELQGDQRERLRELLAKKGHEGQGMTAPSRSIAAKSWFGKRIRLRALEDAEAVSVAAVQALQPSVTVSNAVSKALRSAAAIACASISSGSVMIVSMA